MTFDPSQELEGYNMGLCGLLARYLTHHLIPWKPGRTGAAVWFTRRQVL